MNEITTTDRNQVMPFFVASNNGPTGLENIENDCISIPFLRLAQSNTPQVSDPEHGIEGLKAGMYFNPGTGRIYGTEPSFIILGFFRSWNVWNGEPPDSKFVRTLSNDDFQRDWLAKTHRDERGKVLDAEGNRYVDTRNFFLLSAEHPEDGILMYPMSSTGIPASKKWLAKASATRVQDPEGHLVQAPMWSRTWKLKVGFVKSPKGNYHQVSDVLDCGWIPEQLAEPVQGAFVEAQDYIKARVQIVDKAMED